MAAALRAHLEMLSFDLGSSGGKRILNKHFARLTLAIVLSLTLTLELAADTVAQTARRWGLIGSWSLDCSLPADRTKAPCSPMLLRQPAGFCTGPTSATARLTAKQEAPELPGVR